MKFLLLLTAIASVILSVNGARILAVFPFPIRSHYNVFEPLIKRLPEKGHQVVTISHFPQKIPQQNLTDLDVSSSLRDVMEPRATFSMFANQSKWSALIQLEQKASITCDLVLRHPEVQRIIHSKEKFDAMIIEIFIADCFLGVAHALKIPVVVGAITGVSLPWSNGMLGNPETPSYIPNWISSFTDEMSFFERSVNLAMFLYSKLSYRYYSDMPCYEVAKKYFGEDLPDFDQLRSKVSLILTNGHPVVSTPRSLAPGFKELGAIHIPTSGPNPLPEELRRYLDAQDKNGVIYFSLGSIMDASTMPSELLAAFSEAFEQVPQQILWKCSEQEMPKLPKNVKCIEWAPQLSILCHPNVRLFITHGGLLGSQEAVYCGVPLIGMPIFGDQHLNVAYFVKKGLALKLDYSRISREQISDALNEMLANKSFTETARKASLQFRDRQVPPVDEGVYWIEYLLRHGPNSLKITVSELTWYQYLLLDILFVILAIPSFIIWMFYKLLKAVSYGRKGAASNMAKKLK